jgi:hypothetical protein
MIACSFLANVLITFLVVAALWRDGANMAEAFGADSPARRILACVYGAIGIVSLYALVQIAVGNFAIAATVGSTLFPLQIIYKVGTAAAVGPRHPVVIANLGVVALHGSTLFIAY